MPAKNQQNAIHPSEALSLSRLGGSRSNGGSDNNGGSHNNGGSRHNGTLEGAVTIDRRGGALPDPEETPKVLAVWTSMNLGVELAEFCLSGYSTLGEFEFDVVPLDALEIMGRGERKPEDYRVLMLAFSDLDPVVESTLQWMESWLKWRRSQVDKPLMICLEDPANSRLDRTWKREIQSLADRYGARIVWNETVAPFEAQSHAKLSVAHGGLKRVHRPMATAD